MVSGKRRCSMTAIRHRNASGLECTGSIVCDRITLSELQRKQTPTITKSQTIKKMTGRCPTTSSSARSKSVRQRVARTGVDSLICIALLQTHHLLHLRRGPRPSSSSSPHPAPAPLEVCSTAAKGMALLTRAYHHSPSPRTQARLSHCNLTKFRPYCIL